MNNKILLVVIVVVVAAAAFYGGTVYQKGQTQTFGGQSGFARRFGQNGQNGQNAQNFRPVRGQVINKDNNSLTVKLADGSTKLVILSNSTMYYKSSTASASDVIDGDTIQVLGTQNSDGSVTAQNVQLGQLGRVNGINNAR